MENITHVDIKQSQTLSKVDTVRKVDIDNLHKIISTVDSSSTIKGNVEVVTCKLSKKDDLEKRFPHFKINITGNDGGIVIDALDSSNEAAIMSVLYGHNLCNDSLLLSKAEAETITSFTPNGTHSTNGTYLGNTNIKDLTCLKYFKNLTLFGTGMTSNGSKGDFANCTNLEEVELPDTMLELPANVFMNTKLKSVNLKNVLEINAYDSVYQATQAGTFNGCSLLEEITWTKIISIYGNALSGSNTGAFRACSKLALTELPSSLIRLGRSTFIGTLCNFTNLPANLISTWAIKKNGQANDIEQKYHGVYNSCQGWLSQSLTHPLYNSHLFCFAGTGNEDICITLLNNDYIASDGDGNIVLKCNQIVTGDAFKNNTNLKSIAGISDTILTSAFEYCSNLTGTVDLTNDSNGNAQDPVVLCSYSFKDSGISNIINFTIAGATSLFENCKNITNNVLDPNNSTIWEGLLREGKIPSYCFKGCTGITGHLVVPSGFTVYGTLAFANTNVDIITIPTISNWTESNNTLYFSGAKAKKLIITGNVDANSNNIMTSSFGLGWLNGSYFDEIVYPENVLLDFHTNGHICVGTIRKINANYIRRLGTGRNTINSHHSLKFIECNYLENIGIFENNSSYGLKLMYINLNTIPNITTSSKEMQPYLKVYVPTNMYSNYINDSTWGLFSDHIVKGTPDNRLWYSVVLWNKDKSFRGYYDLGSVPTADSVFYITLEDSSYSSTSGSIFGCRNANDNKSYAYNLEISNTSVGYNFNGIYQNKNFSLGSLHTKHSIICDPKNNQLIVDGVVHDFTGETTWLPSALNLYLFACNQANSLKNLVYQKAIYNFVWMDGNNVKLVFKANNNNGFEIYALDPSIILLKDSDDYFLSCDNRHTLSEITSGTAGAMNIDILEAKSLDYSDNKLPVLPGELLTFDCTSDASVPIYDWNTTLTGVNSFRGSLYYVTVPDNIEAGDYTITAATITDSSISTNYTIKVLEPTSLSIVAGSASVNANSVPLTIVSDGSKRCNWLIISYPPGATVSLTNTTNSNFCILNYSGVSVGDTITVQATYSHNSTTLTATKIITVTNDYGYILFDRNSYFCTDYIPTANTTIQVEFTTPSVMTGNYEAIFGGEDSTDSNDGRLLLLNKLDNALRSSGVNGDEFKANTKFTAYIDLTSFTTQYDANIQPVTTQYGAGKTKTASSFGVIYIGILNRHGTTFDLNKNAFTGKVHYLRIFENGALVKEFIPYATNKMIETLSGTIINNSGTGTATIGQ